MQQISTFVRLSIPIIALLLFNLLGGKDARQAKATVLPQLGSIRAASTWHQLLTEDVWPVTASAQVSDQFVVSTAPLRWPVKGPISSYQDSSHPLGIDIGLSQTPSTEIYAAADGKVTFAGGNPCCSYGLQVVVEHASGLQTRYAHLSRIDVAIDQEVRQGQRLGLSGSTGVATAEHLHFEVLRDTDRLNVMDFMPKTCDFKWGPYSEYAVTNGDCRQVPIMGSSTFHPWSPASRLTSSKAIPRH